MFGTHFGSNDSTSRHSGVPGNPNRLSYVDEDGEGGPSSVGLSFSKSPSHTRSHTRPQQSPPKRDESATPPDTDTAIEDETEKTSDTNSEDRRRHSLVHDLARRFTTQSHYSGAGGENPFFADEDSSMNPNSPHFKARSWAKGVVHMVQEAGSSFRTAGVCFQNMNVFGYGVATDYQKSVGNVFLEGADMAKSLLGINSRRRIDILRNFDGLVRNGEMLVVLGPPGSGCSTFLKTIAGETNGIHVDGDSYFNYQGMTAEEMHSHHRGEAIYTAEVDVHFPNLSVGDTLTFAALARAPSKLPRGVTKPQFANHLRDVVMAMFGISHTVNTRVGNEYMRGVSGGERKRVTIAEAALSHAPLQCWDNSTRGLDSANAIEFCRTLRLQAELFNSTACVSMYQAPQSAYEAFDKVLVLYEGRQIFFGRADAAKKYFIDLGFECRPRQIVPDFLTCMTSPQERVVRPGWEGRAPRTPDEFATAWKNSQAYRDLKAEIEEYKTAHPIGGDDAQKFRASRKAEKARIQRSKSPYTLSYKQQIGLCLWRGWKRLMGDPSFTILSLILNTLLALVFGSVFYNMQQTTASFYQRGALLFFACLSNAFSSSLEILTLYAQRPIVEKHDRYALYHPSAEAVASMLCDMPYKLGNAIVFNLTLYMMTNLRREPGAFFFFLLISFLTVLAMSMIFRTIASSSRTLSQAMVPAAIIILAMVVFTGFVIPIDYMLGWCRWISYVNPLAYSFEAMMVNEFHNRNFTCTEFIPSKSFPGFESLGDLNYACSAVGSVAGSNTVSGDAYVNSAFQYFNSHKWRNVGLVVAFTMFFLCTYMVTAEFVSEKKSKGEVLVFRRGYKPAQFSNKKGDLEAADTAPVGARSGVGAGVNYDEKNGNMHSSTSTFHWKDVCYDITIKGEPRRILDRADGWVKPGTLTALMGVSGAGKTSLLDCLADRVSMGVITGEMLVDGHLRDRSFQRKTGYVQQQDLHLQTTTVREALNFSALLRQPAHTSRAEKLAYVDEVIKMLDMEEYADAVVGVPGEGLNVEQRKRLTIGVELAARPPLLLFVDEPTSGLDSQTSWAILDLLEKLTKSGQAILCTIHQPSAMLFQRFDRLLLLADGGRTVYFGDIGANSKTMISYFERNGGSPCAEEANPAEWMLEVIGAAPGSETNVDWQAVWRESPEYQEVQADLRRLKEQGKATDGGDDEDVALSTPASTEDEDKRGEKAGSYRAFAAPFHVQLFEVSHRVFQQYWRTPSYVYSKAALCIFISLFIGFAFFNAPNSIQGLQNQMFAIFNLFTVFGQLVQQTMPYFVIQRSLYEARERPSKVYSWKVFMLSQILAELPWNTLMAVFMYCCWYYPVGLYRNAEPSGEVAERGALMFLMLLAFLLFTSTFTDMVIAGFETAEMGGSIANMMFLMSLVFCGILAPPDDLPGFWIFMYRLSPFSYLASAMLSIGVANTQVTCAANEFVRFQPLQGQTCGDYMNSYISVVGGYLLDPNATRECAYCTIRDTNVYLDSVQISYADRWMNFGIMWVFIVFNICASLVVYWLARMPKKHGVFGIFKTSKRKKKEQEEKQKVVVVVESEKSH